MARRKRVDVNQGDLFADAEAPKQTTIFGEVEFARTQRNAVTAATDAAEEKRRRAVLGHLYDRPREAPE